MCGSVCVRKCVRVCVCVCLAGEEEAADGRGDTAQVTTEEVRNLHTPAGGPSGKAEEGGFNFA